MVLAQFITQVYFLPMSHTLNPKKLVLRQDTATDLVQIGWDAELPLGRFLHLALICESNNHTMPDVDSEHYPAYQAGIRQARKTNEAILRQQTHEYLNKGWYPVPLSLANPASPLCADEVGLLTNAAMQLHYQLTRNCKHVWVTIVNEHITHVRRREPNRKLDELSLQVWYHQQQHQLASMHGTVASGHLLVSESGLWFINESLVDHCN